MAKKNYNANNKNNNEHVLKNTTTTIAKRLFNFFDRERFCCLDTNERTDGQRAAITYSKYLEEEKWRKVNREGIETPNANIEY